MHVAEWVHWSVVQLQQLVHRTPATVLLVVDVGLQIAVNRIRRHLGLSSDLHAPHGRAEEVQLTESQRLHLDDIEAWYSRYWEVHGEPSFLVRVGLWLGFIPEI